MKKKALLAAVILAAAVASPAQIPEAAEETAVQVKEVSPFAYCCIHKKASFTEIEKTIGELWMHMQKQSIMPTGAMFGIYYSDPETTAAEDLEWEVAFPVTDIATPLAPLEKKAWEYALVASTIHTGPYQETGTSYARVFEWISANGYEQAGPVLERYLTIPGPDVNPEDMKAEIWVPVVKK